MHSGAGRWRTVASAGFRTAAAVRERLSEATVGRGTGMRDGMLSPKFTAALERTHSSTNWPSTIFLISTGGLPSRRSREP